MEMNERKKKRLPLMALEAHGSAGSKGGQGRGEGKVARWCGTGAAQPAVVADQPMR